MPRYAAKIDDNQPEIVAAWRAVGASVLLLHRVGEGCPDTLVGFRGESHLVEIKDGDKIPSARKLTKHQVKFHREWRGSPVHVVKNVDEALAVLGIMPTTDIDVKGTIS